MTFRKRTFTAIVVTALFCSVSAFAQNIRGTILGTVTDETGAVIRGAKVTAHHIATGLIRSDTTNDSGEYTLPQLPVGIYAVSAEQPGFKKVERPNIELRVDDNLRVNLVLSVGQVTETVSIVDAAPVINTDSATVGNVVDNKTVTELPLNGRNFLQLNLLVPGANTGVKGSQNQTQGGSISVNGAREQSNNFLLDGIDNNDAAINQYTVAISTEALQEFKIQGSTYTAEFGRSAGAQINVATKSGSNAFHGSAYEYLRNSTLDAKNFFDRPGAIPPLKRNQYGTAIGGPVKKDKSFFFINWEQTRLRQGITRVATVPTAAMKAGDFSALAPGTIIYDPASSNNAATPRQPFAGNQIMPSRFNPVALNILNFYSDPNSGVSAASGLYTSSPTKTDDFNQVTGRWDHHFSDSNVFFARYTFSKEDRFDTFDPFCSGTNVPGWGCNTLNGGQSAVADYTHLFGSSMVNDLRLGFNRSRGGIFQQNLGNDISTKVGINGTSRSPLDFGMVRISPTGYDLLGEATNLPQDRKDNTYQIADTFSIIKGNHTFKVGEDFRRFQLNILFDSSARGTVNFTPYFTTALANGAGGGGNAIAELLLGDPQSSSISRSFGGPTANTVGAQRTSSFNLYGQDDWRIRQNLTLNLGLRYEYNTPVTEKYNHMSTFDPSVPGQLRIASSQQPNLYDAPKTQFAPRFGFAWTPKGPETVIRGGYGWFWDQKLLNIHLTPTLSAPFLLAYNLNPSTNGQPNIALNDPYAGATTSNILSAPWLENPFKNGYVQQWSFNVQRQLPKTMGLTVGYIGSKGTHLDRQYDANQPQPSALFNQANRPYPAWAALTVRSPSSVSHYNALQASLEKKFSGGLSFLVSHTWSHSTDDASAWSAGAFNPFNLHNERGNSTFDTRQRFTASYTYDVPVGKGRRFGGSMPAALNLVVGGWQTNGIFSTQSGNPLDVLVGLTTLTGTNNNTRPDSTGVDPNDYPHDPAKWFNTAAFSRNFSGRLGNLGRDVVIGPGTTSWDSSLLKRFDLRSEVRYLQFRTEFFNILNHPNFDNPNVTLTSATFGRITSAGSQDTRLSSRQIQFALRLVF
jgi:hypothetical protein